MRIGNFIRLFFFFFKPKSNKGSENAMSNKSTSKANRPYPKSIVIVDDSSSANKK